MRRFARPPTIAESRETHLIFWLHVGWVEQCQPKIKRPTFLPMFDSARNLPECSETQLKNYRVARDVGFHSVLPHHTIVKSPSYGSCQIAIHIASFHRTTSLKIRNVLLVAKSLID